MGNFIHFKFKSEQYHWGLSCELFFFSYESYYI